MGGCGCHEKGGKRHDVPAHHRAEAAVDAYLVAGGIEDAKAPLFQSVDRSGRLSGRSLTRRVVLLMIKRRAAAVGLPASTCCHTFRATGITAYLSNGGTLEHAQQIAGHASPRTTKLYDRTADTVTLRRDRTHHDLTRRAHARPGWHTWWSRRRRCCSVRRGFIPAPGPSVARSPLRLSALSRPAGYPAVIEHRRRGRGRATVRTWSTAWLDAGRSRGPDGFRTRAHWPEPTDPARIGRLSPPETVLKLRF